MITPSLATQHLTVPSALRPVYRTPRPNASVLLFNGLVEFIGKRESAHARASVTLGWTPFPCIQVRTSQLPFPVAFGFHGDLCIRIPGCPDQLRAKILRIGEALVAMVPDPVSLGVRGGLHHVIFHVPNFSSTHGSPVKLGSSSGIQIRAGRLASEAGPWRITLDRVLDGSDLEDELKGSQGFGMTHVGRLERVDGGAFGAAEASEALEALSYALSMSRAAWTSCILPVGYGPDGTRRWSQWSVPRVSPMSGTRSWTPYSRQDWFSNFVPGFFAAVGTKGWEDLRTALHWYVECSENLGSVASSIVLEQVGLELLSWLRFVESGRKAAPGFDKKKAFRKIRLLLSDCQIPLAIPPQLDGLIRLQQANGWADGPHTLTGIRNAIVHANQRGTLAGMSTLELYDAARLGLWYLEMALLNMLSYSGHYESRLTTSPFRGQELPVPWVATSNVEH
jgi:hypothetical protein